MALRQREGTWQGRWGEGPHSSGHPPLSLGTAAGWGGLKTPSESRRGSREAEALSEGLLPAAGARVTPTCVHQRARWAGCSPVAPVARLLSVVPGRGGSCCWLPSGRKQSSAIVPAPTVPLPVRLSASDRVSTQHLAAITELPPRHLSVHLFIHPPMCAPVHLPDPHSLSTHGWMDGPGMDVCMVENWMNR